MLLLPVECETTRREREATTGLCYGSVRSEAVRVLVLDTQTAVWQQLMSRAYELIATRQLDKGAFDGICMVHDEIYVRSASMKDAWLNILPLLDDVQVPMKMDFESGAEWPRIELCEQYVGPIKPQRVKHKKNHPSQEQRREWRRQLYRK